MLSLVDLDLVLFDGVDNLCICLISFLDGIAGNGRMRLLALGRSTAVPLPPGASYRSARRRESTEDGEQRATGASW